MIAANRRTGRYDPDAFAQVVGDVWFELCLKAMPAVSPRWLLRSPLAASAWHGLRRRFWDGHARWDGP